MRVWVVTGDKNGRKTSMLYALCSRLDSKGYTLAGVIQVAALPNKEKIEWILSDQGSGESRFLMGIEQQANLRNFGRFFIDDSTFQWADEKTMAKIDDADFITIDEVGPLELEGEGFDKTIRKLLEISDKTLILVVRSSLLEEVLKHYNIDILETVIYHANRNWDEQLENIPF
jgi:iron complex transport system ATP-binding protein